MSEKFSKTQDNIGFSSSLSALKSDRANIPLFDLFYPLSKPSALKASCTLGRAATRC
jgi:hypothetical protein